MFKYLEAGIVTMQNMRNASIKFNMAKFQDYFTNLDKMKNISETFERYI